MNSKKRYQKKNLIRIFLLMFCASFLLSALTISADAAGTKETGQNSYHMEVIAATPDFYVNDFAGILTETQKSDMMEKAIQLDTEYSGIQVVVTTVNKLSDCLVEKDLSRIPSIEEISYAMFEQYGIGQDDMGILILFSAGDRNVYLSTGRQMQIYITDSKSGQLLDDYGMEYFRNDQFSEGLVSLQSGVISEIQNLVGKDWNVQSTTSKPSKVDEDTSKQSSANAIEKVTPPAEKQEATNTEEKETNKGILLGLIFLETVIMAAGFFGISAHFKSKINTLEDQHEKDLNNQQEEFDEKERNLRQEYAENVQRLKDQHSEDIEKFRRQLESSKAEISKAEKSWEKRYQVLKKEKETLQSRLTAIEDKYSRVQRLYPNKDFDAEIAQMIEGEFKAEAVGIDKEIEKCINLPADKDRITVFCDAINLYENASSNVKKYVVSDIQKLHNLLEKSKNLKAEYEKAEQEKRDRATAQRTCDEIRAIFETNRPGTHETYEALKRAYDQYESLSRAEKSFFPDQGLIESLKHELGKAEEDYNNHESAKDVERKISATISRMGHANENDENTLRKLCREYELLSEAQRVYFAHNVLSDLKNHLKEAELDHEEQERRRREEKRRRQEEERRRRESMNNNSFGSYHSGFGGHGGGFGGFGGHGGGPSGGGAGRGF